MLLDWVRWREQTRPNEELPSPITRHEIPYQELLEVAKFQGLDGFQTGDILLLRTGFVRWHDNASTEARRKGTAEQATYIGVHATPEAVEWIWYVHDRSPFSGRLADSMAGTSILLLLEEMQWLLKLGLRRRAVAAVSWLCDLSKGILSLNIARQSTSGS